uniref:Uncharacterized protein n=1 Tax=viral metagenome TaxID=1070528 RepID=A0A6M3IWD2_9ZZZZ
MAKEAEAAAEKTDVQEETEVQDDEFDEEAEFNKDEVESKSEMSEKDKDEAKKTPGKSDDEGEEETEKEPEKESEDTTAESRIKTRIKDKKLEEEPSGTVDKDKEKVTDKSLQSSAAGMTKEEIAGILNTIPKDTFSDSDVIIGNESLNIGKFAETYPEDFAIMKVIAGTMAKKIVENMVKTGGLVAKDTLASFQAELQQGQISTRQQLFELSVLRVHPDLYDVVKSKDYLEWFPRQSAGVKRMASSLDVDDAVLVLDFYKEKKAKATAKVKDDSDSKELGRKKDVLKGSVRQKVMPGRASSRNNPEGEVDEKALFDEITS